MDVEVSGTDSLSGEDLDLGPTPTQGLGTVVLVVGTTDHAEASRVISPPLDCLSLSPIIKEVLVGSDLGEKHRSQTVWVLKVLLVSRVEEKRASISGLVPSRPEVTGTRLDILLRLVGHKNGTCDEDRQVNATSLLEPWKHGCSTVTGATFVVCSRVSVWQVTSLFRNFSLLVFGSVSDGYREKDNKTTRESVRGWRDCKDGEEAWIKEVTRWLSNSTVTLWKRSNIVLKILLFFLSSCLRGNKSLRSSRTRTCQLTKYIYQRLVKNSKLNLFD